MPHVAGLTIFPIKAFDGVAVQQAGVRPTGGLVGDRRFAIVDAEGGFVNGKRYAAVHGLRASFDPELRSVQLEVARSGVSSELQRATFDLEADREAIGEWLSAYFGFPCRLVRDDLYGFPDDLQAAGPTIISTATLREVARWYPGLEIDEVRRRFRANIEVDGVESFWEDRLYGEPGLGVRFRIGSWRYLGTNPCQRCVVPSRNSTTGQADAGFSREFMARRREKLPPWAAVSRFDHFYRLATNTRLAAAGEPTGIHVGDLVTIEQ